MRRSCAVLLSLGFAACSVLIASGCALDWSRKLSDAGPSDGGHDGAAPPDAPEDASDSSSDTSPGETAPDAQTTSGQTSDASTACECGDGAHCNAEGVCTCDEDFALDEMGNCQRIDDCPPNACPDGTCVDGVGDYTCDCPAGFGGTGTKSCFSVLYCPEDACAPGGVCVDQPNWHCTCRDGFEGTGTQTCTNIDDCPKDTCLPPNGTCEDLVNSYVCKCALGYSGTNCETDVCTPNPCKNGATCSRTTQGAVCDCAAGYAGSLCETDIDECANRDLCFNQFANVPYRCAQTAAPGYTCIGQFADWPMPDATKTAKFAPSYDTSIPDVVVDKVTGLMWERRGSSAGTAWDAFYRCEGIQLAGYNDWRLPSKIEIESILDRTRTAYPSYAAVFENIGGPLWTISPYVKNSSYVWVLNSGDGYTRTLDRLSTAINPKLRCVRGPTPLRSGTPESRYTIDMAADTVTDTRTKLIWQRTVDPKTYTWEVAQTECAQKGPSWRLPTLKELLTLVDPLRASPAISPVFPDTPAEPFWSINEPSDSDFADVVDFEDGASTDLRKASEARVRCVR